MLDNLLIALNNVSSQLLPIIGAIVLVLLCVVLKKAATLVDSLTTTIKSLGPTIKLVDTSMEKVQAPLDTAVKLSHTVDDVHDKTKETVEKATSYVNNNVDNIKNFVTEKIKKDPKVRDLDE